jgi:hypothetical protein
MIKNSMFRAGSGMAARLFGATALAVVFSAGQPLFAQDQSSLNCTLLPGGALPAGCEQGNAGLVVDMPVGENTVSPQVASENDAGFAISINGNPVDVDPRVQDQVRRVDVALAWGSCPGLIWKLWVNLRRCRPVTG